MAKYLFIDLETTGFPIWVGSRQYYHPKYIDFYRNSRVLEVACILDDGKNLVTYQNLIVPSYDIKSISNVGIALEKNGISLEEAHEKGKSIKSVIADLLPLIERTDYIVAHNAMFDISVLLSEIYRLENGTQIAKLVESKPVICTLLQWDRHRFRGNSLGNLYKNLVGRDLTDGHRALSDTEACREIFYKMLEMKKSIKNGLVTPSYKHPNTSPDVLPINKYFPSKKTNTETKEIKIQRLDDDSDSEKENDDAGFDYKKAIASLYQSKKEIHTRAQEMMEFIRLQKKRNEELKHLILLKKEANELMNREVKQVCTNSDKETKEVDTDSVSLYETGVMLGENHIYMAKFDQNYTIGHMLTMVRQKFPDWYHSIAFANPNTNYWNLDKWNHISMEPNYSFITKYRKYGRFSIFLSKNRVMIDEEGPDYSMISYAMFPVECEFCTRPKKQRTR